MMVPMPGNLQNRRTRTPLLLSLSKKFRGGRYEPS